MTKRIVRPGYVEKGQKTVKINVAELKVGMYVCDLDRPWLETPFLMQGFRIEQIEDIEIICQYCQHVYVDVADYKWVAAEERAVQKPASKKPKISHQAAHAERKKALGVYSQARRITKTLLDEVSLGGAIDADQAKSTVNDCVQSVLRNSDALMWMSRLRNEDEYTAEHSLNVCILSVTFGRGLGFSESELQHIGLCGLLHDIGKMKVPESILNKPAKLTEDEFKIMRSHTTMGRNLLMGSDDLYHGVIDVAYSHHERVDGSGYPRGLKASSITQYAKMISIVDAYDAMTADRCYAPAMISTDALKIIYKDRGTHFDEHLALKFIKIVGLYPPGSIVELSSGEVAIVTSANFRYQHLPEIIVVLDKDKQPCEHRSINLAGFVDKTVGKDFLITKVHKNGSFGLNTLDFINQGFQL